MYHSLSRLKIEGANIRKWPRGSTNICLLNQAYIIEDILSVHRQILFHNLLRQLHNKDFWQYLVNLILEPGVAKMVF